ncbi:hypothetical protein LPC08_07400 [Roseomonas sp. OT10]|uniref:hypothetical protein n=1 Tax=Roseomonas cutis TaxID=2897332 RepID=UPI001E62281E|nr:hypothetical protein [Roseomonas sp. OT10]UFN50434.1 hypothetical protein LPC08_07400 [Roseomonas sp. OT10]
MAIPSSARGAKGSQAPAKPASATGGAAGALRCAVCGTESRQPRPRHQPPEQAPDLDLRPGEPLRSTMASWLQQCPHCGYAAPDITRAHPAAAQAVAAAPFRALVNDSSHPPLARRFLGWAHVLEESGALHAAAEATLQAAWIADDERLPDLARAWRLEAVALWRAGPPLDHEQTVRVVDALRRAGEWGDAAASARAASADHPPEAAAQVLALEARLITAQDDGRHTVASALPPPSRRPHVSHHRPAATGEGLWGRFRRWLRRD